MCMGGGGGSYSAPKVDPAPTVVQSADVQANTGKSDRAEAERRRRGRASVVQSQDRDTILGALAGRNTLG